MAAAGLLLPRARGTTCPERAKADGIRSPSVGQPAETCLSLLGSPSAKASRSAVLTSVRVSSFFAGMRHVMIRDHIFVLPIPR
jgi:hypothetical protein